MGSDLGRILSDGKKRAVPNILPRSQRAIKPSPILRHVIPRHISRNRTKVIEQPRTYNRSGKIKHYLLKRKCKQKDNFQTPKSDTKKNDFDYFKQKSYFKDESNVEINVE